MKIKITGLAILSLVTFILTTYLGIKFNEAYKLKYKENRLYVIKTSIEYDAKRCYLEKSCSGTSSIGDLYSKGYISESLVDSNDELSANKELNVEFDGKNAIINWPEEINNINK